MAHAYMTSIEEELTCCVCFELFVDPHTPKDLTCPHVICELCLKKLVRGGRVECPECREITKVPKDGVTALRTNLVLRNLAEKHLKHLEQKRTGSPAQSQRDDEVPLCQQHAGEKMHFVCKTCSVSVCQACVVANHHDRTQHNIKDVKTVHQEWLEEMTGKIQSAEWDIERKNESSQKLDEMKQDIQLFISSQEKQIDRATREAIADVHNLCAELKGQVRQKYDATLQQYQGQKDKLLEEANDLEAIVTDGQACVHTVKSHDFVTQYSEVTERLSAVQVHGDDFDNSAGQVNEVSQVPLNILKEDLLSPRFIVDVQANIEPANSITGAKRKLQYTKTFNLDYRGYTGYSIKNIASNRSGNILAVCLNTNHIHVYFKHSDEEYKKAQERGKNNCTIQLPEQYKYGVQGFAVAEHYIYVATGNIVIMYLPNGQCLRELYRNHDYDNGDRYGYPSFSCVTTTQDGHIIVGEREHGHGNLQSKSFIVILTSDGKVEKKIETKIQPMDIAAISNIKVALVTHTGVCVFGLISGKEIIKLQDASAKRSPYTHVFYDKESDSLLVGGDIYENQLSRKECVVDQYSLTTGCLIGRCINLGDNCDALDYTWLGSNMMAICIHSSIPNSYYDHYDGNNDIGPYCNSREEYKVQAYKLSTG